LLPSQGPKVVIDNMKVDKKVTGVLFLSVEGGSNRFTDTARQARQILEQEGASNIYERAVFGPFDLVFTFEVDRLAEYDHKLNSLLDIQSVDLFSIPCVRIFFDNAQNRNSVCDEDIRAFIFMRSRDRSVRNYRKLLTIFRSLDNVEPLGIEDVSLEKKITAFIAKYKNLIEKPAFYFTYSLFDLLMVVSVNEISVFSEFLVALRDLLESEIDETSTMIGFSGNKKQSVNRNKSPQNSLPLKAEIAIKIESGRESVVCSSINNLIKKRQFSGAFSWKYGDCDLLCRVAVSDFNALIELVIGGIRNIEGVTDTSTSLYVNARANRKTQIRKKRIHPSIGTPLMMPDSFSRARKELYQQICDGKSTRATETAFFWEIINKQFSQLEQIIYRLRYLAFRWQRYQKYLPQISAFDSLQYLLLECLTKLKNAKYWDNLENMDRIITEIHRTVTSLERGFYQRLESLDILRLSSTRAKGIEKLGSFERVLEAMDTVANNYLSPSGEEWKGLIVSGIWKEEFQTEMRVDLIYAPTFSKIRMKTWPLIAHEAGHYFAYNLRQIGDQNVFERIKECVDKYQTLFIESGVTEFDENRVTSEVLADIVATYFAGTSFVRMLVEHLYSPSYFFDNKAQDLTYYKGLVPVHIRIRICAAVLEKINPSLGILIAGLLKSSEDATDLEEKRMTQHMNKLLNLSKLIDEASQIKKLPYPDEVNSLFNAYIRQIKLNIEKTNNRLDKNEFPRQVGEFVGKFVDNASNICEAGALYKHQFTRINAELKYKQTMFKQGIEFAESLCDPKDGESILDEIFKIMKRPSPFAQCDYDTAIDNIRKSLLAGQIIYCNPSMILETFVSDRKGELNENAAILSILLYKR
jgi:DNA-binding Lrp family transcriptional regulator